MKKSKVLILGGGSDQKLLVEEFNYRGFQTIVIDYLDNPPAKSIASIHYKESTYDEDAIRKIAKKHNVDYITTISTDQPLLIATKVSEELRLPCYISAKQALSLTNKSVMKNLLSANNIPTARHTSIEFSELHRYADITKDLNYPLIVKPVDSSGSRGINKIYRKADLLSKLQIAFDISRSNHVIVEEFIDGIEVSVDNLVINSSSNLIMISDNFKAGNHQTPLIDKSLFPSVCSHAVRKKIESICQKLADVYNLNNAPLFVQMIVKDDEVFVIELSARVAGGSKPVFINNALGFNIVSAFVDLLLNQAEKLELKLAPYNGVIGLGYLYGIKGLIKKYLNAEELKKEGIINDIILYRFVGDTSLGMKDTSCRIGTVLIKAKDYYEFEDKLETFKQRFLVINEDGENILVN